MNAEIQFTTGAAEDGSLMLEWGYPDGRVVCFFIEEEDLPATVAEVRDGNVYSVKVRNASHLARLLDPSLTEDEVTSTAKSP